MLFIINDHTLWHSLDTIISIISIPYNTKSVTSILEVNCSHIHFLLPSIDICSYHISHQNIAIAIRQPHTKHRITIDAMNLHHLPNHAWSSFREVLLWDLASLLAVRSRLLYDSSQKGVPV